MIGFVSLFSILKPLQLDTTPNKKVSSYGRKITPNKRNYDYLQATRTPSKAKSNKSNESNDSDSSSGPADLIGMDCTVASKDFMNNDVAGSEIYQLRTPKKSDCMKRKAENTPKSPATILSRLSLNSPKTPRMMPAAAAASLAALRTQSFATPTETRSRNKKALLKAQQQESESESSADEHSEYEAEGSSDSTSNEENANAEATSSDDDDDFEEPKHLPTKRNAATKEKAAELPTRTRGRPKKKPNDEDFIPDSDNYFLTAANKKVTTK